MRHRQRQGLVLQALLSSRAACTGEEVGSLSIPLRRPAGECGLTLERGMTVGQAASSPEVVPKECGQLGAVFPKQLGDPVTLTADISAAQAESGCTGMITFIGRQAITDNM